ncbi:UPF0223 family protein [Vagococcus elongatus]|uniref:Uncharacterized protein n=1 Tax=Vagococcus elongatus TaxID=180344 RepID=A0A430B4A1_9ENTE|nr:UPF0223 family protein [Vagococcus elongatus]RSU15032.1 hypothetical protein CBF29_01450 [Vagococcus elongatus]
MEKYYYPLNDEWSHEEIVTVMNLWTKVEEAYEEGVDVESLSTAYHKFKEVVPSIGEEKTLGREFEKVSGYSLYRVMQAAKQKDTGKLKM